MSAANTARSFSPPTRASRKVATAYIAQLGKAHVFDAKIVTRVDPLKGFYPAEGYHQDFAALHPDNGYIAENDLPKIDNLRRLFPALYPDRSPSWSARAE